MDEWVTQLRKGLVEFCILKALAGERTYGYRLVQRLRAVAELTFTESTVYPALNRLVADGCVRAKRQRSRSGPPRRFLSLTAKGRSRLARMADHWSSLCAAMDAFPAEMPTENSHG